jgi:hypothetical protein
MCHQQCMHQDVRSFIFMHRELYFKVFVPGTPNRMSFVLGAGAGVAAADQRWSMYLSEIYCTLRSTITQRIWVIADQMSRIDCSHISTPHHLAQLGPYMSSNQVQDLARDQNLGLLLQLVADRIFLLQRAFFGTLRTLPWCRT